MVGRDQKQRREGTGRNLGIHPLKEQHKSRKFATLGHIAGVRRAAIMHANIVSLRTYLSVVIPCFSNPLNYSLLHCTKSRQKTRNPPSLHRTFDPLRYINALFESIVAYIPLLDCDRFGQVPGEIDIEAFANSEPVGNELQRNDVQ